MNGYSLTTSGGIGCDRLVGNGSVSAERLSAWNSEINGNLIIDGDFETYQLVLHHADITVTRNASINECLIMQNDDDRLLVNGNLNVNNPHGSYYHNDEEISYQELLTAGTVEIKGNFNSNGYYESGTHTTKLSGQSLQRVCFNYYCDGNSNYDYFNFVNLVVDNPDVIFDSEILNCTLTQDTVITNPVSIYGTLDLNGHTLFIAHDIYYSELVKNGGMIRPQCIDNLEHIEESLATCYENGTREHWECTVCGKKYADSMCQERLTCQDVIIPIYHIESEPVIENNIPTSCSGNGRYDVVVYCSECHTVLSRETIIIPALEHTPAEPTTENNVSSSCSHEGHFDTVVYCSVCGEELSRETTTVPALAHTPSEPATENNDSPSCLNEGHYDTVVYCSVCGEELSRETTVVPALGHTPGEPEVKNVIPQSCLYEGHYDSVVYCSVCGEEISRETIILPALGHTPAEPVVENEVAPTCYYSGHFDSVVYCSACGEEISRDTIMVFATGHNIKAFTVEPTCTDFGYTNYICVTCGNLVETKIIPAKGHTPQEAVTENEVAATCSCPMHYDSVVYCADCGEEISRATVTVPGTETPHTFVDYRYNGDATETADGTKTAKCVYCDATDTIPFPGSKITDSLKDAKLTVSKSQMVYFGSDATIKATATGVPSDYYLVIFEGGNFIARGDNESVSCVVEDITEDRVFTVKIVDKYGNAKNSGNTHKDVTVKVKTSFIYRLIEFLRILLSLFRKANIA